MQNDVELLARTYSFIRRVVTSLDVDLFDRPSPCEGWNVGAVFEHMLGAVDMFSTAVSRCAVPAVSPQHPLARFDAAVTQSLHAWTSVSGWDALVPLPFGEFPASLTLGMNQMDALVHGWDLGVALGLAVRLPDDLAQAAFATAQVSVPPFRGRGFASEVATTGTTPGERLLAFTGRNPGEWPGSIWLAGSLITINPTGLGDGSLESVVEIWEREGCGPPRHIHHGHDEIWYVLEGQFTFELGAREVQAGPGDVVVGPRGVPHAFRADTARSRMLDFHSPAGFERFFVKAGEPARELVPPVPSPAGPVLRAALEEYGATVVGPPLARS